jgi:hypothetical protein
MKVDSALPYLVVTARIFVTLTVLVAAWFSASQAIVGVARQQNPQRALAFGPNDALALARTLDVKIAEGFTAPNALNWRDTARVAIRNEALTASALRSYGYAVDAAGRKNKAARVFALVEKISRREAAAQIWLIEYDVARENVKQALVHYDTVLRTSPEAQAGLLPILVSATEDRTLLSAFVEILSRGPKWRYPFYALLTKQMPSSENAAYLYHALRGTRGAFHKEAVADLISSLAAKKDYSIAYSIYARAAPEAYKSPFSFSQNEGIPPFDWQITDSQEASVTLSTADSSSNRSNRLDFRAEAEAEEPLARKLLVLPRGKYRLYGELQRDSDPDSPVAFWTVACVEGQILTNSRDNGALSATFEVPRASCTAQWVTLNISTSKAASGWLKRVSLLRG